MADGGEAVSTRDARQRIDSITWFHELDFGDGLAARPSGPDAGYHDRLWSFLEGVLDGIDFAGRSVLDLGCWDGYWSFYAERRGARRVLATDDATQNWGGGSGVQLAKELYGSEVELRLDVSVYDLSSIEETFDVILFTGIYYHLIDPFYALAQVRHLCHPGTVVVVEGDTSRGLRRHRHYVNLGDRFSSIFIPRADDLADMLRTAYFEIDSEHSMVANPLTDWREYARLARRLLRKEERTRPPFLDRTALVCRPVADRHNPFHYYRPPFGLDRYDPRFAPGS